MAQKNKKSVNVDFDVAVTTVEFNTLGNCVIVRKSYINIDDGASKPVEILEEVRYPLEVYPLQVALSLAAASVQQVNLVKYEQE